MRNSLSEQREWIEEMYKPNIKTMEIKLGYKVKDRVTGFIGIAVCKAIYLNGCVQYEVKPPINEKGETVKGNWVDEAQLEFVDHGLLPEPERREPKRKPNPLPELDSEIPLSKDSTDGPGGGQREHPH